MAYLLQSTAPPLAAQFASLKALAPGVDIDIFLDNVITAMRQGWSEVVSPLWHEIKEAGASCESAGQDTKETSGYREVFTRADIQMSERFLEAFEASGLEAYYTEEHGPYSGKYEGSQQSLPYRSFEDYSRANVLAVADPLDGSKEFVHGLSGFAMHVALLVRHNGQFVPVIGIVYVPARDELWYNSSPSHLYFETGGKTFLMDKVPEVDLLEAQRRNLQCHFSPFDLSDPQKQLYRGMTDACGFSGYDLVDGGAAGSSLSLLLQNRLDVVVAPVDFSKQWDNAMVEPLLKLRGGWQIDATGSFFSNFHREDPFNRNGYIACVGLPVERIIPKIPGDLIKQHLAATP